LLDLSPAQVERLPALPYEELRVLGFGEPFLPEHTASDLFKTLVRIVTSRVIEINLGNLWRRLVLPKRIDAWSLTSLQQRLVKTGGRLIKR